MERYNPVALLLNLFCSLDIYLLYIETNILLYFVMHVVLNSCVRDERRTTYSTKAIRSREMYFFSCICARYLTQASSVCEDYILLRRISGHMTNCKTILKCILGTLFFISHISSIYEKIF